jgi:hypothetical protein
MLAGNAVFEPWAPSGAYDSIATTTLSSTTASITFSSIPATYTHLQIRMSARSSFAYGSMFDTYMAFNGDNTYTGYKDYILYGNGSTVTATAASSYNLSYITPGASQTASVFNGVVVDILDYANTSKNTVARFLGGADLNGSGNVVYGSILWPNTAAVNQIVLSCDGSFVSGSKFALYGIKGA